MSNVTGFDKKGRVVTTGTSPRGNKSFQFFNKEKENLKRKLKAIEDEYLIEKKIFEENKKKKTDEVDVELDQLSKIESYVIDLLNTLNKKNSTSTEAGKTRQYLKLVFISNNHAMFYFD